MKPGRRLGLCLTAGACLLLLTTTADTAPSTAAEAASHTTYYLSLGDSVAGSAQPVGGLTQGYTEAVYKAIRADHAQLRHVKLGCGGESAASIMDTSRGGYCPYPKGSPDTVNQLDVATEFIAAHPGRIELITLTIGANDIRACLDPTTLRLDQACLDQTFPAVLIDLATVLATLKAAAPGVPIVGMDYYNVFLGLWVFGPDARAVALHDAPIIAALNAQLAATYEAAGVRVADVAGAFDSDNFAETVHTKQWGEIPVNVANICTWTWFCDDQYTFDVHANTTGYQVISNAFLKVIQP